MHIGVLKAGKYSCQFHFKIHVEVHVLVFFNSLYEFKVIYLYDTFSEKVNDSFAYLNMLDSRSFKPMN